MSFRKQRGLRLTPLGSTPRVERSMEDVPYSINGKSKPKQLRPLDSSGNGSSGGSSNGSGGSSRFAVSQIIFFEN